MFPPFRSGFKIEETEVSKKIFTRKILARPFEELLHDQDDSDNEQGELTFKPTSDVQKNLRALCEIAKSLADFSSCNRMGPFGLQTFLIWQGMNS